MAVIGYVAAGWQFLDALYMVVITVFGVGYGETRPLDNPALKVFTMAVIISGCSSGIYFVGGSCKCWPKVKSTGHWGIVA